MVKPTIYTTGGTVQAGSGIYLERQADAALLTLCRKGAFAYILTPRQMGKSSLMVQTAERLSQEGIHCVIIDLTQMGVKVTAEQWYLGLLTVIEEQLELETNVVQWWQERIHLGLTQRMTQFFKEVLLAEVAGQVVVFVDEIDSTLSLDFTDDFFAVLRYLYVARAQEPTFHRLSFILIGVATPGDLIRDPKRTPFNVGQRVDLTDFTLSEVMPLVAGLGLEAEAEQVMQWVLKWTGGHPYLTQRLCGALVESQENPGSRQYREADVEQVVSRTFLGVMSEQDNNLQFVRDMLTKRAPQPEAVLRTYREIRRGRLPVPDEEQSLVKSHLKLSGVVRREGKHLVVRNPIYHRVFDQHWIREHLPETLWQRYKSVLKWAVPLTAASVLVAVVMAGLAREAQRQTVEAKRQKLEAQRQKDIAVGNAQQAALNAQKAKEQAQRATIASKEADMQQQAAKEQAAIAQQQRQRAEEQATLAQEETHQAKIQTGIAVTQTRIAQQEKKRAEHQTQIAQLREQAAQVLNLLPTTSAAPALVLAIDTMSRSVQAEPSVFFNSLESLIEAVQTEREQNLFQVHQGRVLSVSFSPDGQTLASAGHDGTVRLWSKSGQLLGVFQGHQGGVNSVSFSPDGQTLASAWDDGTVRLWSKSGQLLGVFQGHQGKVNSVSFSPDGQTLASAGLDGTVRLWSKSGQPLGVFRGHQGVVNSVSFSSDGQTLASAGLDDTVRLWYGDWTGWLEAACTQLQNHLLLQRPETIITSDPELLQAAPELLQAAHRARAVCQQRVWKRQSISGQPTPLLPMVMVKGFRNSLPQ
ncbi:MAG: AAA-like domain-containing protein [Chroococcidiopsidaceae cyanobacterium CP_BM_RX_35]|nr:AAA-like domain-containing protein [Chroococcidiopsidaceae cyanobacterium CP_BM_RX_35]